VFFNLRTQALGACESYWVARAYHLQTLAVSFDGFWFSGSFSPGVGEREVSTLVSGATFDALVGTHSAAGWVPRDINISVLAASDVRYSAIWQPAEGKPFVAFREQPRSTFEMQWAALYADTTLTDWVIRNPASPLVTGAWQKLSAEPQGVFAAYYNLTSADFQAMDEKFVAVGLSVTQLRSYDWNGQVLYAAIWRPVPWSTRTVRLATLAQQPGIRSTMEADGYYLYQLHAIDADRFTSVWRHDP
jgi:hypothetical protein